MSPPRVATGFLHAGCLTTAGTRKLVFRRRRGDLFERELGAGERFGWVGESKPGEECLRLLHRRTAVPSSRIRQTCRHTHVGSGFDVARHTNEFVADHKPPFATVNQVA